MDLCKQVLCSTVRMKRVDSGVKKLPARSFNLTFTYTLGAGIVKVTLPVTGSGGPWRFNAIPGVEIPEAPEDNIQFSLPKYKCQVSRIFPVGQVLKFPSEAMEGYSLYVVM